jgi:hypothetical protein
MGHGEAAYGIREVHYAFTFRAAYHEHAKENVPQIEAELVPHVRDEIYAPMAFFIWVLVAAVDADTLFFVAVAHADADRNRVDGDVHHDEQTELYRGVHFGKVES